MKNKIQTIVTLVLAVAGIAYLTLLATAWVEDIEERFICSILLGVVLLILYSFTCDPAKLYLQSKELDREKRNCERLRAALRTKDDLRELQQRSLECRIGILVDLLGKAKERETELLADRTGECGTCDLGGATNEEIDG